MAKMYNMRNNHEPKIRVTDEDENLTRTEGNNRIEDSNTQAEVEVVINAPESNEEQLLSHELHVTHTELVSVASPLDVAPCEPTEVSNVTDDLLGRCLREIARGNALRNSMSTAAINVMLTELRHNVLDRVLRNHEQCDAVKLQIHVDEVNLFKGSRAQLWPILGRLTSPKTAVFIVGVFSGETKPVNVLEYFEDLINEMLDLQLQGHYHVGNHQFSLGLSILTTAGLGIDLISASLPIHIFQSGSQLLVDQDFAAIDLAGSRIRLFFIRHREP
ncbi:uncharacterized protein DEA37_0008884 [Paragonimus westermani]|uniref:Uncharacterized protein n=1 Tax=Paragonimus westermani TaxID=34504 RepID=A0A5J4N6L7_9TREM|nr:uncharacterized protein DEA37_0008884 [Paragonimus westermani]